MGRDKGLTGTIRPYAICQIDSKTVTIRNHLVDSYSYVTPKATLTYQRNDELFDEEYILLTRKSYSYDGTVRQAAS